MAIRNMKFRPLVPETLRGRLIAAFSVVAIILLLPSVARTIYREFQNLAPHKILMQSDLLGWDSHLRGIPAALSVTYPTYMHPGDAGTVSVDGPPWNGRSPAPTFDEQAFEDIVAATSVCGLALTSFDTVSIRSSHTNEDRPHLNFEPNYCKWAIAPQREGTHIGLVSVALRTYVQGTPRTKPHPLTVTFTGAIKLEVEQSPLSTEKLATYVGLFSAVVGLFFQIRGPQRSD